MPSFYDEKSKCRVGEMDLEQFYRESDEENGKFFRALLEAWNKAGGSLKWGAGGVGLRTPIGASGNGSKEVGVCFLAPKFAGKQDRIELSCSALKKQLGEAAVESLHSGLRAAAADHFKGTTMVSIVGPGKLGAKSQLGIINALMALTR